MEEEKLVIDKFDKKFLFNRNRALYANLTL